MSALLRTDPAGDAPRSIRELAEQLEGILWPSRRQLAPALGARWVEVSRSAPTGTPRTFARPSSERDATRDIALAVSATRIPHPLGRVPEGVAVLRNSAGARLVEGQHDANFLHLTPDVATVVRLQVS